MFRLCRELKCPHPDFLTRILNYRQIREWAAFERIEPFETERADVRQSVATWWERQSWIENHTAEPSVYQLNLKGAEDKSEAEILMDEVKELFSL